MSLSSPEPDRWQRFGVQETVPALNRKAYASTSGDLGVTIRERVLYGNY